MQAQHFLMNDVSPRRRKVALGLVGTGPLWDQYYQEAVRRKSKHVVIRGVFDAVQARAEQTARDWQAVVAPSLTSLFERPEIDAVLLLDTAWHGLFPLELACRFRKPTLCTGQWGGDVACMERIHASACDAGITLMSAFPRRHTPATNRLRELMVTKLGPPVAVCVETSRIDVSTLDIHQIASVVDWCGYVVGKAPASATTTFANGAAKKWQIDLEFPAASGMVPVPAAQILLQESTSETESAQLRFRDGSAIIRGETEIWWQHGGHEVHDSLASEQTSTDIILDQFCRRVVGGLVPVTDLADVLRGLRIGQAIQQQISRLTPSTTAGNVRKSD